MHSVIRNLLDNEKSPRYIPESIDAFINSTIHTITGNRYDNEKKARQRKNYSFQSSAKLRDELATLIRYSPWIIVADSTDFIPRNAVGQIAGFPADFNFLISVDVTVSGNIYNTTSISYDEESIISQDPKRRPQLIYPERVYYIEYDEGLRVLWGNYGKLQKGKLVYLKTPTKVYYGIQLNLNELMIATTKVTPSQDSIIYSKLINAPYTEVEIFLPANIEYTVPTSITHTYHFKSGEVIKNYINSDMPVNMHEEICRKASAMLTASVENFERKNDLDRDDNE